MTPPLVTYRVQVHARFTLDDPAVPFDDLWCGAHEAWQESSVQVPPREWLNVLTAQRFSTEKVQPSDLWREVPVALPERVVS